MSAEELARRAVACKGWRWMPGMAWFDPANPEGWHGRWGEKRGFIDSDEYSADCTDGDELPDLADPATIGCLMLTLIPDAYGGADLTVRPWPARGTASVSVYVNGGDVARTFEGESLAEALVAALEAAQA